MHTSLDTDICKRNSNLNLNSGMQIFPKFLTYLIHLTQIYVRRISDTLGFISIDQNYPTVIRCQGYPCESMNNDQLIVITPCMSMELPTAISDKGTNSGKAYCYIYIHNYDNIYIYTVEFRM